MKQRICVIFLLMMMAGAFVFWKETAAAIRASGERCVTVIIPSLYLCSILSALCIRTGMLERLSRPLERISKNSALLIVLLFSQIGGYPIGAQLLYGMHTQGRLTLARMQGLLCVCICSGPAFLFGTVCGNLDVRIGWLMLLAVALPNLLGGLLMLRSDTSVGTENPRRHAGLTARTLTESVESGASAMWKISSMIVFFGACMGILEASGILPQVSERIAQGLSLPEPQVAAAIACVMDVSCLPAFLQSGGSLPMTAALLSFGGLCVHCQIAALCGGQLPWRRFWLTRCAAAAASWWCCRLLLRLCDFGTVPAGLSAALYAPQPTQGTTGAVWCLAVMTVLLLLRHDRFCRWHEKN